MTSEKTIRFTLVEYVDVTEKEIKILEAIFEDGSVEVFRKRVPDRFGTVDFVTIKEEDVQRSELNSLVEKKLLDEKTDYNHGYNYLITSGKGFKILQEIEKKQRESEDALLEDDDDV